jgi:hypothetical protein
MGSQLVRTGTRSCLAIFAMLALGGPGAISTPVLAAQQKVKLSAVIAGFLADSGIRTRGLPWTTGAELPIRWESARPIPNPDQYARAKGIALIRSGSFTGTVGDTVALKMEITLGGSAAGLAHVVVNMPSMQVTYANGSGFFLTREMVEKALGDEGVTLQPLKCSRDKEGASYGNLVDAVKVPGKTASGLWWFWQSPQQEPSLSLSILYRRTDMGQVECYSG